MAKRTQAIVGISAAIAIALTGCSTKADDGSSSGSGDSGDVKTDVGVTDTEIKLGVLTDMSGPFKEGGLGQTHGNELWADDVNAAGGICGRDIVLDVQDMGYKADNAVPMYETMKQENLGLLQLLGSPILAALKQKITTDKVLSVPGSWASTNLDSESVLMVGQTYDVEMINIMAWAQEQGLINEGDKLGHIYVDSEYGQNGLLGSQSYAKDNDMEIVPVAVAGTDTDMTATVTKLKADGVKAILLTVAPAATASVAVQNAGQGLNVPMLGNNPTFAPAQLQNDSVVQAFSQFYVSTSVNSFSSEDEMVQQVLEAYEAKGYEEAPYDAVLLGYSYGLAWEAVLNKACDEGDLTRQGILDAKGQVDNVDTKELTGPLDFSVPGASSSRQAFIAQPDKDAISGTKIVEKLYESEAAKKYKAPFEK
ncbi:ABC transporter substrate-binding protein [Blastococcus sp. Marseille-P5729]|uniref:ABC transporter substrate-binding protein n=1 Tax=Blastococcus sp. Marseille-P5729 TaxID=2086582 RepID=UPI000D0EAE8C|nr:ABC transporter substrate-binding protein [Blastococcus sp. Marseille-P5729]